MILELSTAEGITPLSISIFSMVEKLKKIFSLSEILKQHSQFILPTSNLTMRHEITDIGYV